MRKSVFVALGAVAAVAAIAVAASQLGGGPSGGASVAPQGTPAPAAEPSQVLQSNDAAIFPQGAGEERAPSLPPGVEAPPTGQYAGGGPATGGGPAGQPSSPLPQVVDRKVIRTATLELTVEDVGAAAQEVETAALSVGGFVSGSSLLVEELPRPEGSDPNEPPPKRQTATVTIRVPAEAYAGVMSRLRGIAQEISSEGSEASEVTEEYTDLQARLRNLEATEGRYLELLAKAESIADILTVQDRLNGVRLEIEQVQGRINLLDNLTDMATITVQLRPPPLPQEPKPSLGETEPNWAEEAWQNAWEASQDALEVLGTAAITAGVVLVWLVVPGLAALIGWRLLGPRRERGGEA